MTNEGLKNKSKIWKLFACIILCFLAAGIFSAAATAKDEVKTVVTVKASPAEMVQDGELPVFTAEASVKGDAQTVLNEDTGYKVQDLLDDLNRGKNYRLSCETDGKTDGEFPIDVTLSNRVEDTLVREWLGKVKIEVKSGTLVVKNKKGEWEGEKFKKTNGRFASDEFIVSGGNTYYFGKTGEKATGWQEKDGQKYYFDKKGIMQTGWLEKDGVKSYLKDDGSMTVGWMEQGTEKYYFDIDGKMLTGKQRIGMKECEFADDGKLLSEKISIDPDKPMIALTFDDGPGKGTEKILEVLELYGARATFFMLGPKTEAYPDAVKKMQEIGCELGNHSYSHIALTQLSAEEIQREMKRTSSRVADASGGFETTVMRPPYGEIDGSVRKNAGHPIIMWSVDTLDWKTRDTESTVKAVMESAKDGDIVLMHDIHEPTVEAAIQVIPLLVEKGYQLVTVSELAEARGIELQDGEKYIQFYK